MCVSVCLRVCVSMHISVCARANARLCICRCALSLGIFHQDRLEYVDGYIQALCRVNEPPESWWRCAQVIMCNMKHGNGASEPVTLAFVNVHHESAQERTGEMALSLVHPRAHTHQATKRFSCALSQRLEANLFKRCLWLAPVLEGRIVFTGATSLSSRQELEDLLCENHCGQWRLCASVSMEFIVARGFGMTASSLIVAACYLQVEPIEPLAERSSASGRAKN